MLIELIAFTETVIEKAVNCRHLCTKVRAKWERNKLTGWEEKRAIFFTSSPLGKFVTHPISFSKLQTKTIE